MAPYAEQIEKLLTPIVGEFMSKMAVKSQCATLGITPQQIGPQHLAPLAQKIGLALGVSVEKAKVAVIVTQIQSIR